VAGGVLIGKNRRERGEMKITKGGRKNNRNDSDDSAEDNEYWLSRNKSVLAAPNPGGLFKIFEIL